jgi:hypothetical protein
LRGCAAFHRVRAQVEPGPPREARAFTG